MSVGLCFVHLQYCVNLVHSVGENYKVQVVVVIIVFSAESVMHLHEHARILRISLVFI